MKRLILTFAVLCLPGWAAAASCQFDGQMPLFDGYSPFSSGDFNVLGEFVLSCDPDDNMTPETVSWSISIGASNSGAGTINPRRLGGGINGDGELVYNLYRDAGHVMIWGDGSGGSSAASGMLSLPGERSISLPVNGQIPAGQNVPYGSYSDSLVVTVEIN